MSRERISKNNKSTFNAQEPSLSVNNQIGLFTDPKFNRRIALATALATTGAIASAGAIWLSESLEQKKVTTATPTRTPDYTKFAPPDAPLRAGEKRFIHGDIVTTHGSILVNESSLQFTINKDMLTKFSTDPKYLMNVPKNLIAVLFFKDITKEEAMRTQKSEVEGTEVVLKIIRENYITPIGVNDLNIIAGVVPLFTETRSTIGDKLPTNFAEVEKYIEHSLSVKLSINWARNVNEILAKVMGRSQPQALPFNLVAEITAEPPIKVLSLKQEFLQSSLSVSEKH